MADWGTIQSVHDFNDSKAFIERTKASYPEVPSAYQPSGKLPGMGIVALLGGGLVASLAGAATGAVAGGITVLLFALMGALIGITAVLGFVLCITVPIEIGIGLIGGALTFGGLGWVCGYVTSYFGKLGKNRNREAAIGVSMIATLAALAMLGIPTLLVLGVTLTPIAAIVGAVIFFVGLFAAGAGAWYGASDTVNAQKFCEPCDVYMEEKLLLGLNFRSAQNAFTCIQQGRFDEAAQSFHAQSGIDFEPALHRCPQCGAGYLDAQLWVRTSYVERGKPKDEESHWRAFSTALAPQALLPFTHAPTRTP